MLSRLMPGVPLPAAALGAGGLIPFIAGAVVVWLPFPALAPYAIQGQLWYAATILSFLGAVH